MWCGHGEHNYSDGGCGSCDSCDIHCSCSDSILDYSENVLDHCAFFGNPHDLLWLGVELEVEVVNGHSPGDIAERWRDKAADWLICKHDGSLDHGFELVTAPSDLQTHAERWTALLADTHLTKHLRSWDTTTCGLHVHVSRKPLSQLTIGKLLVFMNSPKTAQYLTALAGRNSSRWAKMSPKKVSDATKMSSDRYQVVNLCNDDTIEFRLFKGTLNREHALANIQFCHAVVRYVKDASMRSVEDWHAFASFVQQDKTYKILANWLTDHNLE